LRSKWAAGKGFAIALGQTGATVYVIGRNTNGTESPVGGTVADAAAAVTEADGRGIAGAPWERPTNCMKP